MVDMHRHLPQANESFPHDMIIWFATSDRSEWSRFTEIPQHRLHRHGYGILPQALSNSTTLDSSLIELLSEELDEALANDPLGYVGEIGLDERFQEGVPLDFQFSLAYGLIQVAKKRGRPSTIHHIGAMPLLESLLKKAESCTPTLIHGYVKSVESARKLADLGATVSLGPSVWTHRTRLSEHLTRLDVPFLLETDYPFVSQDLLENHTYEAICKLHLEIIAKSMDRDVGEIEEQVDGQATLFTHW